VSHPHPLSHPRFAALVAATLLAAALSGCGLGAAQPARPAAALSAVGVYTVKSERLTLSTELPGRTSSPLVAEIRPQVGGIVKARRFTEGATVQAGQVLYEIDPASFQAAFASAQASVAKAEAALEIARLTAQRQAELAKIEAVSEQDSQNAQATLKQADADVKTARAAQETARINLERTTVRAPIAGRVDVSSVSPGALVTADQATALTTVRQIDPIQVDVSQSSAELLRLKRDLASGRLQRTAAGDATVKLLLEDGSAYARSGQLRFNGVSVNTGTGAVTLRAVFDNREGLLLPGMYVRAVLETGVAQDALLLPQQAVTRDSSGAASALVVDAQNKVARRALTVDRAVGNRWLVSAGLQVGERVVVEGAQKAHAGDTVQPHEAELAGGTSVAAR
jgi:membrane fusion protein (multidrug efflux system)